MLLSIGHKHHDMQLQVWPELGRLSPEVDGGRITILPTVRESQTSVNTSKDSAGVRQYSMVWAWLLLSFGP